MKSETNNNNKIIDGTGLTESEIERLFDFNDKINVSFWLYRKAKGNAPNIHDIKLLADLKEFIDSTDKLRLPHLNITDAVKYLLRIGLETFKERISEVENEK